MSETSSLKTAYARKASEAISLLVRAAYLRLAKEGCSADEATLLTADLITQLSGSFCGFLNSSHNFSPVQCAEVLDDVFEVVSKAANEVSAAREKGEFD